MIGTRIEHLDDHSNRAFLFALLFPSRIKTPAIRARIGSRDAGANAGQTDDADNDQINGQQEHSDVFGEVHGGIVGGAHSLCTLNLLTSLAL